MRLQGERGLAALVEGPVLEGRDRFDHLTARAEVVELCVGQGHDGARERRNVGIALCWIAAEARPHAGVEFVEVRHTAGEISPRLVPTAFFKQYRDRPRTQEPEAGIDEKQMINRASEDFGGLGFLEKEGELVGAFARGEKHAEVRGGFGVHPHSEPNNVGFRHQREFRREAEQHIATGQHHATRGRRGLGDVAEAGELDIEKGLVQPLTLRPAQGRERHEDFSRGGVGGETAALPARHESEFQAGITPVSEGFSTSRRAPGRGEEMGYATAGAEFGTSGVACGEPIPPFRRGRKKFRHRGRE